MWSLSLARLHTLICRLRVPVRINSRQHHHQHPHQALSRHYSHNHNTLMNTRATCPCVCHCTVEVGELDPLGNGAGQIDGYSPRIQDTYCTVHRRHQHATSWFDYLANAGGRAGIKGGTCGCCACCAPPVAVLSCSSSRRPFTNACWQAHTYSQCMRCTTRSVRANTQCFRVLTTHPRMMQSHSA